jgi:hypothetical protein
MKIAPVIISGHLCIFRALLLSERFYFPSAFIFGALLLSERFYFPSAFIFRALLFSERIYFLSAFIFLPSAFILRAPLFCFPNVSQPLFIFSFQEHYSAPTLISG